MKAPKSLFPSTKVDMPRFKMVNIPLYSALNRGTEIFREKGFSFSLSPQPQRENVTLRLYMSKLHECGRLLWLQLNAPHLLYKKPYDAFHDPDNWRAGHMGDLIEEYTVYLLTLGGIPVNGRQKRLSDFDNKFSGKIDGIISIQEKENLLEIKALKHAKIVDVNTYGLHLALPEYYSQMQLYMYYLNLASGYFVAFDCDTRQYYVEYVKFNQDIINTLRHKVQTILNSFVIQQIPEHFIERNCFFCPARQICKQLSEDFEGLYKEYQEKKSFQEEENKNGNNLKSNLLK